MFVSSPAEADLVVARPSFDSPEREQRAGGLTMRRQIGGLAVGAILMVATACGGSSAAQTAQANHPKSNAPAAPSSAKVVIVHEQKGCHDWSVNNDAPSATQTMRLVAGGTMMVTDNDVMPHRLIQTGGPKAELSFANMNHMGASSTVAFPSAGVYTFTTKAGEDYSSGIETVGEDHTLKLTVTVV